MGRRGVKVFGWLRDCSVSTLSPIGLSIGENCTWKRLQVAGSDEEFTLILNCKQLCCTLLRSESVSINDDNISGFLVGAQISKMPQNGDPGGRQIRDNRYVFDAFLRGSMKNNKHHCRRIIHKAICSRGTSPRLDGDELDGESDFWEGDPESWMPLGW